MPPVSAVVPNVLRDLLSRNEPSYVFTIRLSRTVDVVGIAAASGHQAFYVDLQHNTLSIEQTTQMAMTGLALGVTPLVRVPSHDAGLIGRLLDYGVQGIIAPDVRNAEDARAIVRCCKFPPHGDRSVPGTGPHTRFLAVPLAEVQPQLDAATLVICMVESIEAVEKVDEIAAVAGVDALFVGSSDLTSSMGIAGQFTHPKLKDAFQRTIAACKKHGKHVMVGGIKDASTLAIYTAMGASRCYFTGNDTAFLLDGAKRQMAAMQAADEALKG